MCVWISATRFAELIQFQILVSASYFLVSRTTAMISFNIETLNSGENRPL